MFQHAYPANSSEPMTWKRIRGLAKSQLREMRKVQKDETQNFLDIPFLAIDPANAHEHDDAIYAEPVYKDKKIKGYKLFVAISNVAKHVPPDSPIDQAAKSLGFSVYNTLAVKRMLPGPLTNGICSLKAGQARDAVVIEIDIDLRGNVKEFVFHDRRIKVHANPDYQNVDDFLQGGKEHEREGKKHKHKRLDAKTKETLKHLHDAALCLKMAAKTRGELDVPATRFKPIIKRGEIVSYIEEKNDIGRMIVENFMITAGFVTATALIKHYTNYDGTVIHLPLRHHPGLHNEQVIRLATQLEKLGIPTPDYDDWSPKDLADILDAARTKKLGKQVEMLIASEIQSSIQRAHYSGHTATHFGLGLPAYGQVTSPLRRYADLMLQRATLNMLANPTNDPEKHIYPERGWRADEGTIFHLRLQEDKIEAQQKAFDRVQALTWLKKQEFSSYAQQKRAIQDAKNEAAKTGTPVRIEKIKPYTVEARIEYVADDGVIVQLLNCPIREKIRRQDLAPSLQQVIRDQNPKNIAETVGKTVKLTIENFDISEDILSFRDASLPRLAATTAPFMQRALRIA